MRSSSVVQVPTFNRLTNNNKKIKACHSLTRLHGLMEDLHIKSVEPDIAHCYLSVYCSPAPFTAGGFLIDIRITADTKLSSSLKGSRHSSSRGRRGGGGRGRGNIILSRKTYLNAATTLNSWKTKHHLTVYTQVKLF